MRRLSRFGGALALALLARAVSAATVDGALEPAYGSPISLQTTQTSAPDNTWGLVDQANGSELDAAYGFISGSVLHLFFAANLEYFPAVQIPGPSDFLHVFIDSKPGGQHTLANNNPDLPSPFQSLNNLAGLTFDSGFGADYWVACGSSSNPTQPPLINFFAALPAGGGGAGQYLGTSAAGGPGTLSGGSNPFGVEAAIDNRNVAGVTTGCGAATAGVVTTGVELAIPLAAIGDPTGCIQVCAFISDWEYRRVSNQVLGPVPAGTCELGAPSGVDFSSIPDSQMFTICPAVTPTLATSWGRLKARYR